MLGLLQRLIDEETGAQPWEAESMPPQVAEAYRSLDELREKQMAGTLGSSAHDFRLLDRAQHIVRQWEQENSVPAIEIPVKSEVSNTDEIEQEGLESSPERPMPELGGEPVNMFVPSRSRPVPHLHTHGEESTEPDVPPEEMQSEPMNTRETHQVFVAGIIADEFRPMPYTRVEDAPNGDPAVFDHSPELHNIREGIRAARAELELLEHRLDALINLNS